MKVAVVGASGFIGRALVERLDADGEDVVPIVRSPGDLPRERVSGAIDGATDWTDLLTDVDVLFHAAARVHVMRERAGDAIREFRTVNRDGTLHLARQAAEQGVSRLVFISTIKVNGEMTDPGRPFKADDPPRPTAPYAISKFEAEEALKALSVETGMEIVIVRPPLVYGAHARGNFASMKQWLRRGIPLPLGGLTRNLRSLVSIDNLVDLLSLCARHPEAAGETFLVSDGQDVSTAGLLRKLGEAMGKRPLLIPVPPALLRIPAALLGRGAEADRLLGSLQVDIDKTRSRLGWRPPVALEEGLARAVGTG